MPGTVTGWLQLLRNGDDSVTEKLWSHYSPGLRNRLAQRCQGLRICDEDDIATTSFYRLISSLQSRDRYQCTNRTDFWRLLMIIARNAIGDWRKYDQAFRRGGGHKIVSLNDKSINVSEKPIVNSNEKRMLEKFKQLSAELDRPEFMKVIELKQTGLSNANIAMEMGYSLRTVQYIIADIKAAWQKHFCEED